MRGSGPHARNDPRAPLSRGCAPLIGTPSRGYFWRWRGSKKASAFASSGGGGGGARPVLSAQHRRSRQPGARTAGRQPSSRIPALLFICSIVKEDEPRKQPPVSPGTALVGSQKEPSEVPTPKRPRGRPKGSKNKGAAKTRKTTTAPGRKPRGRPKKLEKEEEEGISQESSEEEQ
ncbi:Hypothetical predicted protein [Marmota monax]|uniref:High mobility group protein HMG-I/HMG-Y n=1 Tax=Marmota monax TaxID=9995 RepID=A0A5E4AUX9_MARMO|nr:hypothetical protein GHT09_016380 [Marmota monax]VTJ60680.1 Hypothetical predicted protein [Marmota monax]